MAAFFHYLLFASFSLILCSIVYRLLLKRLSFHRWNRMFILSAILASLALPCINVHVPVVSDAGQEVKALLNTAMPAVATTPVPLPATGLNWAMMLVYVYIAGAAVMFVRLMINILRICRLILQKEKENVTGYTIIRTAGTNASFFRYIFLRQDAAEEMILQHEMAHGRQWHSADILLAELVKIFFWFNPAIYKLTAWLKALHEYEADEMVAISANKQQYAHFLLSQHETEHYTLLHSSAAHPLKIRIQQLFTPKSHYMKKALYLLLLPCLVLAASGFSLVQKRLSPATTTYAGVSGVWSIETRDDREELVMQIHFHRNKAISSKEYEKFFEGAMQDMAARFLKQNVTMSSSISYKNDQLDNLAVKLTNMKNQRAAGAAFRIPALSEMNGYLIIGVSKKTGELQVRSSEKSVVMGYDLKGIITWNRKDNC